MNWICRTCGVEQAVAEQPPSECAICTDERQYVLPSGPAWTTSNELVDTGFGLRVDELERGRWGFTAEPKVGIGQTALLARSAGGNLLFDVPPFVAPEALRLIVELGGVAAIMASHPHCTARRSRGAMPWGDVLVYVAQADRAWVQRTDPVVVPWSQPFEVLPGVSARQVGGHFRGQTIVRWPGADGAGVLLVGDACSLRPDSNVSFQRSYPNLIPPSPRAIGQIVTGFDAFGSDRLYDNFAGRLAAGTADIVHVSAESVRGVDHGGPRRPRVRLGSGHARTLGSDRNGRVRPGELRLFGTGDRAEPGLHRVRARQVTDQRTGHLGACGQRHRNTDLPGGRPGRRCAHPAAPGR